MDAAYSADQAFARALRDAGFPSRWEWHLFANDTTSSVAQAYRAKLLAEIEMREAFTVKYSDMVPA